ncbi:uncharacterized protein LOC113324320 isoform X2 [Papaver somniferum]|uniref:uncharacterized protein LOC113324320 isoform X2 n=1 Tax=Papaver somniferum TaxID=3469 RepID=UPI000E6FDE4C|nr:uncharacterized protein LOC113324320 isoform X2 [Papaver somniferum]
MAGGGGVTSREQTLSLLSAVKNHGDLAVKLSSLRQAKDILLSVEPSSLVVELFPYIVELQGSNEVWVRKILLELMEELGLKVMDQSSVFMPVFLAYLKDDVSSVVRQSIVSGTNFFRSVLEEMALQYHQSGKVERWLEELWSWMVKFKDAICGIALESGPIGTKLLAIKFLEMYILLFTSDAEDDETSSKEVKGQNFNISWVVGGHPILVPDLLTLEANRSLGYLLDMLRSAKTVPGSVTITVVNCLAAIARRRPMHYTSILSALLGFDTNFEIPGSHAASIQYSFRTAFLGFLRCTHPCIVESRDRLVRALRAMNAGDAADQVIRKVDKIIKNTERASRDARFNKDQLFAGELNKKRSMLPDGDSAVNNDDLPAKRTRYLPVGNPTLPVQNNPGHDGITSNGVSTKAPLMPNELTPVEQMIAMIAALLAEGERGAGSLEMLISKIQPDLMADIVIANMRHLPKNSPPLSSRLGNMPVPSASGPSITASQVTVSNVPITTQQSPVFHPQAVTPFSSTKAVSAPSADLSSASALSTDLKRDPRRDPRRLDPRRLPASAAAEQPLPVKEITDSRFAFDASISMGSPVSVQVVPKAENSIEPLVSKSDTEFLDDQHTFKEDFSAVDEKALTIDPSAEVNNTTSDVPPSDIIMDLEPVSSPEQPDFSVVKPEMQDSDMMDFDQNSPAIPGTSAPEETFRELPPVPSYIELTGEEQNRLSNLAVGRLIESSRQIHGTGCSQTCMELLARLVLQTAADQDIVSMVQKHIVSDYEHQKGHELAMHVLYHLRSVVHSCEDEFSSFAESVYEKFLLAVAKSLRDTLPASDRSFSRFLGEVPLLPDSALKLLEDLCCSEGFDNLGKDVRDGDRVTQGLGTVWSLILGRPLNRKACLTIAFNCSVHPQEDVRAKAIRLVANKLYRLSYASEKVEEFATNMLLSVIDQRIPDTASSQVGVTESNPDENVGVQETSISGSQNSDPGVVPVSNVSLSQAQRCMSLFFALCTKKPSLLQLVFDVYGRAPKTVKQAVHRHIPNLVRNLGSSCPEFLRIISDPPQGSENLLMLVLQVLTEETIPSADLMATVKHLYQTKLKDAAILIPMLSSLPKDEVLPIFPQLVGLPLEKFQAALARILQGSAHTGPALTPAEVLVAIHGIRPERDGVALKKITDACTACFEQRTVFTQQVLAKALNQLVDQTPLPLLFMRTVIQAIDAFPTLVDFVMEILTKLVNKQIWKMPKLWVGFLKCASQTQPHSFDVLLQLPPPQLESTLNRHANLRAGLASHANQPSIRSTLPRSTLAVLGLANEPSLPPHAQRSYHPSALHSETGSSVQGATLT